MLKQRILRLYTMKYGHHKYRRYFKKIRFYQARACMVQFTVNFFFIHFVTVISKLIFLIFFVTVIVVVIYAFYVFDICNCRKRLSKQFFN